MPPSSGRLQDTINWAFISVCRREGYKADEETEAQQGSLTGLKPHSQWTHEPRLLPPGPLGFPQPSENINRQLDQVTSLQTTGRSPSRPALWVASGFWALLGMGCGSLPAEDSPPKGTHPWTPSSAGGKTDTLEPVWREPAGRPGPRPGERAASSAHRRAPQSRAPGRGSDTNVNKRRCQRADPRPRWN